MLAIAVVAFAHGIHHFDASVPTAASQIAVDNSGSAPHAPNKAGVIVEHCLGCTIIAVAADGECALAAACRARIAVAAPDAVRSHDLALELPPPKSST